MAIEKMKQAADKALMSSRILKNKPLVEAILEIKWRVGDKPQSLPFDADYRLFLGRFYDRVRKEYPVYEALPAAAVPEQMAQHIAQYRFRLRQNGWPLLQIGPGLLTLNDTDSYVWSNYEARAIWALERLVDSYPGNLEFESLLLRYIDAVEVDFTRENLIAFLSDKLKVSVTFPESLFQGGEVDNNPSAFMLNTAFKSTMPRGTVELKFAKGNVKGKDALLWETLVFSSKGELPTLPADFGPWLGQAHVITDDWFFKLIEGELLSRFE